MNPSIPPAQKAGLSPVDAITVPLKPNASTLPPTGPKLPPALRKPGSEPTSKAAIAGAAKPAPVSPPSAKAPTPFNVRPLTGGIITPTTGIPSKLSPPISTPKKLFVPPPKSPHNPKIPVLDRLALVEGSFMPEGGDPFTVETILTGDPLADRQALVNLARKRNPTGKMKLASQRIFTRDRETPPGYVAGTNLGQLFGEAGSDTESGVEIGHVFFEGSRCQIFLRNLRSRSAVTIMLRPAMGGQIVFSNQLAPNRPISDLGIIVKEILGNGAREITITLREA